MKFVLISSLLALSAYTANAVALPVASPESSKQDSLVAANQGVFPIAKNVRSTFNLSDDNEANSIDQLEEIVVELVPSTQEDNRESNEGNKGHRLSFASSQSDGNDDVSVQNGEASQISNQTSTLAESVQSQTENFSIQASDDQSTQFTSIKPTYTEKNQTSHNFSLTLFADRETDSLTSTLNTKANSSTSSTQAQSREQTATFSKTFSSGSTTFTSKELLPQITAPPRLSSALILKVSIADAASNSSDITPTLQPQTQVLTESNNSISLSLQASESDTSASVTLATSQVSDGLLNIFEPPKLTSKQATSSAPFSLPVTTSNVDFSATSTYTSSSFNGSSDNFNSTAETSSGSQTASITQLNLTATATATATTSSISSNNPSNLTSNLTTATATTNSTASSVVSQNSSSEAYSTIYPINNSSQNWSTLSIADATPSVTPKLAPEYSYLQISELPRMTVPTISSTATATATATATQPTSTNRVQEIPMVVVPANLVLPPAPELYSLISIAFTRDLPWSQTIGNQKTSVILLAYIPVMLQAALNIPETSIFSQELRAYNSGSSNGGPDELLTLYKAYIPKSLVNMLNSYISDTSSPLYTQTDSLLKQLSSFINPTMSVVAKIADNVVVEDSADSAVNDKVDLVRRNVLIGIGSLVAFLTAVVGVYYGLKSYRKKKAAAHHRLSDSLENSHGAWAPSHGQSSSVDFEERRRDRHSHFYAEQAMRPLASGSGADNTASFNGFSQRKTKRPVKANMIGAPRLLENSLGW